MSKLENSEPNDSKRVNSLLRQGWISLTLWIVLGILIEGLIGFRIPALMDDSIRREMLRLAHAHGTLLNLVLITATICGRLGLVRFSGLSVVSLRFAVLLLPTGFLIGGLWHYQDDPGFGIFLVPIGAILLLTGASDLALSVVRRQRE